jgi:hypothetical protein
MEVLAAAFDEDEALRTIQTQEVNSADTLGESGEAVITEDAGIVDKNNNRGDEGVLEGVAVGNIDVYSDDSDEDEVRFPLNNWKSGHFSLTQITDIYDV